MNRHLKALLVDVFKDTTETVLDIHLYTTESVKKLIGRIDHRITVGSINYLLNLDEWEVTAD